MKNENDYIIELCKFIQPDSTRIKALMDTPLNYPYILGQLLYNRAGAIAYYTLLKCGLLKNTNREFRNSLKTSYKAGINKTDELYTVLRYLYTVLKDADFRYAVLKGAFLAKLYPLGLRTSNDIDILIAPENITALSNILKAAGFKQGYIRNEVFTAATRAEIINSRMNRGETVPFIKELNNSCVTYLEVDINFSLDFKPQDNDDTVKNILSNLRDFGDDIPKTLSETDFLIHLCVHLFKEATVMSWINSGRDLSLYKFCDIYLFISTYQSQDFYKKLKNRILNLGLNKECYFSLFCTSKLFNITDLSLLDLLNAIKPDNSESVNRVIDPAMNKVYEYDIEIKERIFCSNRREHLHEIRNG